MQPDTTQGQPRGLVECTESVYCMHGSDGSSSGAPLFFERSETQEGKVIWQPIESLLLYRYNHQPDPVRQLAADCSVGLMPVSSFLEQHEPQPAYFPTEGCIIIIGLHNVSLLFMFKR